MGELYMTRNSFANVKWKVDDILSMNPKITKVQAREILSHLEDSMIEEQIAIGHFVLQDELQKRDLL